MAGGGPSVSNTGTGAIQPGNLHPDRRRPDYVERIRGDQPDLADGATQALGGVLVDQRRGLVRLYLVDADQLREPGLQASRANGRPDHSRGVPLDSTTIG